MSKMLKLAWRITIHTVAIVALGWEEVLFCIPIVIFISQIQKHWTKTPVSLSCAHQNHPSSLFVCSIDPLQRLWQTSKHAWKPCMSTLKERTILMSASLEISTSPISPGKHGRQLHQICPLSSLKILWLNICSANMFFNRPGMATLWTCFSLRQQLLLLM